MMITTLFAITSILGIFFGKHFLLMIKNTSTFEVRFDINT